MGSLLDVSVCFQFFALFRQTSLGPYYYDTASNGALWQKLSFGTMPWLPSINLIDTVNSLLIPESGKFNAAFLVFPALVGAAVVGSFERRIKGWLSSDEEQVKES